MIFPRHVRSGRTPYSFCAPPAAARNPEITSSKTAAFRRDRKAPQALQEAVTRRDESHVSRDRLDEQRRDLPADAAPATFRTESRSL